nr:MAG TPA: hypothetical protein [Caudoviricetes sp.]
MDLKGISVHFKAMQSCFMLNGVFAGWKGERLLNFIQRC